MRKKGAKRSISAMEPMEPMEPTEPTEPTEPMELRLVVGVGGGDSLFPVGFVGAFVDQLRGDRVFVVVLVGDGGGGGSVRSGSVIPFGQFLRYRGRHFRWSHVR